MGLIGQTVSVKQGPYKGHYGVVKDATETTARVELHASCQTINVDRSRLMIAGDSRKSHSRNQMFQTSNKGYQTPSYTSGNQTPSYTGNQTPMYGNQTPLYGSQTPMHDGSQTPHYGLTTPSHDGGGSKTPRGGSSAWDPSNANTPAHTSDAFDYNAASPYDNATTPNPHTPGSSVSYQSDEPSPGNPYDSNPQTPGPGYTSDRTYNSPFTATPSPHSYDATPSPASAYAYQATPSPGTANPSPLNYQHSPAGSYAAPTPSPGQYQPTPSPLDYTSPLTPGGSIAASPMNYRAPGSVGSTMGGGDHGGVGQQEWQTTDIIVQVKQNDDEGLVGKQGVIRSITGGLCNVYIADEGRTVTIPNNNIEPVLPSRSDKVKVILGEDREATGELISIDDKDGIVRMDQDKQLKILQLRFLGKVATSREARDHEDDISDDEDD